jgi:hypothetical protein
MYWWLMKLLLPVVIPLLTTGLKQIIDKFTPIALEKIPKPLWASVPIILSQIATAMRPDLFLLPGLPPEVSTALYATASMGARELVDQTIKVVNPGTQPTGM